MQLEAVYLTTTGLRARSRGEKKILCHCLERLCAPRRSSWELKNVASSCAGRNKRFMCSLHRKAIGGGGRQLVGWSVGRSVGEGSSEVSMKNLGQRKRDV